LTASNAPASIEAELKNACPLIGQAILIGDDRPFLAALIVLEPPERAADPAALAAVAEAIERVNAASDPREWSRHTRSCRPPGPLATS
jgi:long-subunit acyl-CoA synthetase (AMP-forming)